MTLSSTVTEMRNAIIDALCEGEARAKASGHGVLVSQAMPFLDKPDSLSLFAASKRLGSRVMWAQPAQGFSLVGAGRAVTLDSQGSSRFEVARRQHQALLRHAVIRRPAVRGAGPVLMGGFRYDTDAASDAVWSGFPDALLILPTFLFTRSGAASWLTVNVMATPETSPRDLAAQLSSQIEELVSTEPGLEMQPAIVKADHVPSQDIWLGWVRRALDSIRRGDLDKVVLARRKTLSARSAFSIETALNRLHNLYPGCTIFAFDSTQSAFIGATPERLASVEAGTLSLDCLAGSAPRGGDPEEDRVLERGLLDSPKERLEHASVVKVAADALNHICSDVRWDRAPEVMKLKTIQHLRTSFSGRLKPGCDMLEAVRRMHPTPAVGGVPTDRAVKLIGELEGDRGWYAAPVGWVDAAGEGEFAVAIRSALIKDNLATLFAGAGIVQGSDPDQEFAETEAKLQPLLAALTEAH